MMIGGALVMSWYCYDCGCVFDFSSGDSDRNSDDGAILYSTEEIENDWGSEWLNYWIRLVNGAPSYSGRCFMEHDHILEIDLS